MTLSEETLLLDSYCQGYKDAVEDMKNATHKDCMNEGAQNWLDEFTHREHVREVTGR